MAYDSLRQEVVSVGGGFGKGFWVYSNASCLIGDLNGDNECTGADLARFVQVITDGFSQATGADVVRKRWQQERNH